MRQLFITLALLAAFLSALHASEEKDSLMIKMSDPNIRITIPGIPGMDIAIHPMNEREPDYRLHGSLGETSVSIITPKINAAITPISCATAIANFILSQQAVGREQMFLGRANEQTFLIIYGLPLEQAVLLNTHIVSADRDTQCIEAHVTKISTSDSDIEPWFNGFGDSNIEHAVH